jgi:hypothetical protein
MNKKELFIQIYCAGLSGAAASNRGKLTDAHIAIAAECAHKSIVRLEEELEKYDVVTDVNPPEQPKRRGRPPAAKKDEG